MHRKTLFIFLLLFALIALSWAYFSYRAQKERDILVLYGNVDIRQVDLGFRVPGRVNQMFFEEGDFISPGQLLGVLDDQPYQDQVGEAKATVESSQAALENAKTIFKRRQELISDGSVSQEDLDTAQANQKIAFANLSQAKAALAVAQTNFSFIELHSPSSGTILTRIREVGAVVNPSDPIYTLSIISPVWVRAFISEPDLGLIYPGMPAQIFTDSGTKYEGRVGFISPVAEFTPKTVETTQLRTDLVYRLRIYADNPDQGLRQGMPVTVHLPLKQSETHE